MMLLTAGVALAPACAQVQVDDPQAVPLHVRSIAITATDRVTQQADVATVHIGYQLFAAEKDAAYAAGSKASNAIIDALRAAGVAKDAIESQQQSLGPTEPYQINQLPAGERASHAFTISQSWTVRATPDDAARILDLAVKAGANQSGDIDWSLKDPNAASAAAAAKALQRAKVQAQAMAEGLGVHLGELLYASNEVEAQPVRPVMAMAAARAKAALSPLPLAINPRQIETSATVRAVFAIE
ncbi:MAG TPA: SIMPL domain-containing protein [Acidobacteriaceae bacterium]|nr:SIMPL domain-containing protein [Acidobacteriaceae bacterium]